MAISKLAGKLLTRSPGTRVHEPAGVFPGVEDLDAFGREEFADVGAKDCFDRFERERRQWKLPFQFRASSEPVWSGPPRPRYCIEKSARFSALIPGTHSPARSQSRNAR